MSRNLHNGESFTKARGRKIDKLKNVAFGNQTWKKF